MRDVVIIVDVSAIDWLERFLRDRLMAVINDKTPERFAASYAIKSIAGRFDSTPEEFEKTDSPALRAVGGLLYYVSETQKNNLEGL